ncbi:RNA polymerase II-binding domain-containing protein [Achaetomium macrosporum]|uniref:RNA polymerase II-binding domain-containing protein n=1 Tax=Achaetomium macrosporum TaxID=79813 RepID=A0AAN7CHT9_9PEZI|nr:RNA polymerase II-binding domain-containing protein [Achaetomium macrosporum]
MAYTDDAVLSKLSALNESHESIATTAQWIMFHRRHASQTVHLWLTKLKDLPSAKRLNMIYLANEVTQQSKARHKDDFLNAFSPFIADATAVAYKGAPIDVQGKLRRVVDVWRDRSIFDKEVLQDLDAKLAEIDRARPTAHVGFGGHAFNPSAVPTIPPELNPLVKPQQAVAKAVQPMKNSLSIANTEYDKLADPTTTNAALPVQAARLNGVLKALANAEGAVTQCIQARRDLIRELEKILVTNRDALGSEEKQMMELSGRRTEVEQRKQATERAIVGALATANAEQLPGSHTSGSPAPEPDRPQVEALTPPHVQDHVDDFYGNPFANRETQNGQPQPVPVQSAPAPANGQPAFTSSAPGIEILSNLASQYQAVPLNGSKKRKIDASDEFPDLGADDGIDADVKEMLRKDTQAS